MTERTILVENIGPIERVAIPVPEGGGVTVLRGRNGSGKSTALEAVDALTRGTGKLNARARYGTRKGSAEGLGASLTVGLQRSSRKGELEVESFTSRVDVAALVDPGIKDPAIADRYRIATACGLAEITPDPEQFRALSDVSLDEALFGEADLVLIAARVRAEIQEEARKVEEIALKAESRARALDEAAGEVVDAPGEGEAQDALEGAIAHRAALAAQAKAATEAQQRAHAARSALDEIEAKRPAEPVDALAEQLAVAKAKAQAMADRAVAYREKVAAAEKALEQAQHDLDGAERDERAATAEAAAAEKAMRTAERHVEELQAARDALESATTDTTAPSAADIEAAEVAVADARGQVAQAAAAKRADEQRVAAVESRKEAHQHSQRAIALRGAASRTDEVLAHHLASVMPQGLRVLDGRLVVERSGRLISFGELSEGERWRIALDIAVEAMGGEGIVPVPQHAWESLDGDARRAIVDHARLRRINILTAEADHGVTGALRAEEFRA